MLKIGPSCRNPLLGLGLCLTVWALGSSAQELEKTTNQDTSLRFEGRILDAKGEPVAGLDVSLSPRRTFYDRLDFDLWASPDEVPSPALDRGRTDGDGFYSLKVSQAGIYQLRIEGRGFRPHEEIEAPLMHHRIKARFLRVGAVPVSVRVRGESSDGHHPPLPGARVLLSSSPRRPGHVSVSPKTGIQDRGTADADGRLRLLGGEKEALRLAVTADGYVPKQVDGDGGNVEIVLRPGTAHHVVLRDAAGRISGARLALADSWLPLAETDEEGRATLWLNGSRPLSVDIYLPDGRHATHRVHPSATAERAQATPEVLTIAPPNPVTVTVIEKGSRDPVISAWVVPFPDAGRAVRTDRRGTASFVDLGNQPRFLVSAPGYVRAGGKETLVALEPAGSAAGRVADEAGRGIPFASLRVDYPGGTDHFETLSGQDGRISIHGIPVGKPPRLFVAKMPWLPTETTLQPFEAHETRQLEDLVLRAGHRAEGRVESETGEPVAGAEIKLIDEPMEIPSSYRSGPSIRATTDGEGKYRVEGLDPELTYRLDVSASGYADSSISGIRPSGTDPVADLGTVTLLRGFAVNGIVTNVDGDPLAGARLRFRAETLSMGRGLSGKVATTGSDGRFMLADLHPDEPITGIVTLDGYRPHEIASLVPSRFDGPLRIELRKGGRVSGRVVDPSGKALAKATVGGASALPGSDGQSDAHSDADGRFDLENLPSGPIRLWATRKGYQAQELSGIELEEGSHHENVEIILHPGLLLTAQIVDDAGDPIGGAHVRLEARSRESSAQRYSTVSASVTGNDGQVEFGGLAGGSYAAFIGHEDFAPSTRSLDLDESRNVTWTLNRGASVRGHVTDAAGAPIFEAQVEARGTGKKGRYGSTDEDGLFELKGLEQGTYKIFASKKGYASGGADQPVVVGEGGLQGLHIELADGITVQGRVTGLSFDELQKTDIFAAGEEQRLMGRADFEGRFSFDGVGAGDWAFFATSGSRQSTTTVRIDENGPNREIVLDFDTLSALSGRILHRGKPLSGAKISLRGRMTFGSATTDLTGRFHIGTLEDGSARLKVTHSALALTHLEDVTVPSEDLVIELASSQVQGIVRNADSGAPVEGATIRWRREGLDAVRYGPDRAPSVTSDTDGRFHLGSLSTGPWSLNVSASGFSAANRPVEVVGDGDLSLDIALQPTDPLSFKVEGPSGSTAWLTVVVLTELDQPLLARTILPESDGRVRLRSVPPGMWRLLIAGESSPTVERTMEAPGDGGTVRLPRGGALVLSLAGGDELVASVRLRGSSGRVHRPLIRGSRAPSEISVYFDQDLSLRLEAGSWTVEQLSQDGHVATTHSVTIVDGGETSLNLTP